MLVVEPEVVVVVAVVAGVDVFVVVVVAGVLSAFIRDDNEDVFPLVDNDCKFIVVFET